MAEPDDTLTDRLPDGWVIILDADAPYYKLWRPASATIPNRFVPAAHPDVEDCVVIVANHAVGVTEGPGAKRTWLTDDPGAAALPVVETLEEWIDDGGDPRGGPELDDRLDRTVSAATDDDPSIVEEAEHYFRGIRMTHV